MNTISLKPINLLKFAGTLMEMVHDIGLLEMIMNKCFTFLLLQDGSFHYYNTNGTFGDFGTTDEGRTFIIFHDKTNIIVHGESSGDVYFHMYNPLKDKWIKSVDSLFVENNNKLSFHDPKESKMYFFVGEDVLTIHSYKIVPLDNERERISNIMDAEYFAILVQNVEEVQMKGIPVTVKSSDYGLFIVFRKALQFYQFETGKLIDIPFSPSEFRSSEFRSTQFYVHPQTSDGIIISERGEVYIIDPRSEIILPIHIGTIQSPPNPYKIHFFYRYIIVTTTTTMIIYDIHNIKNYQTIQLEIDYDVNSIVVWNNPDVSIGFYSNKCKTFNEFLLSENTNYTNDMKNGLLPILLSNFQKTILNNTQMSTITISKFLDRLGNDLPLIIFLSTQSQYRSFAIDRFKKKYTKDNLLSMSNTWNIDQINSYFNELGIVDQPKEVIIPKPTKSWNPRCFNVADVTVQLSQSPTEEKVNKVYEMLHIEKIHGNLIIPDELITSLRNHKVNWFLPLIVPLLKLRPYELLQHMIIITDDMSKSEIIMFFQQTFSTIELLMLKDHFNNDQCIVYAIFKTVVTSFEKALDYVLDDTIPILLDRLMAFPLEKLAILPKSLFYYSLLRLLLHDNFNIANMVFSSLKQRHRPRIIQTILEELLQDLLNEHATKEGIEWVSEKIIEL